MHNLKGLRKNTLVHSVHISHSNFFNGEILNCVLTAICNQNTVHLLCVSKFHGVSYISFEFATKLTQYNRNAGCAKMLVAYIPQNKLWPIDFFDRGSFTYILDCSFRIDPFLAAHWCISVCIMEVGWGSLQLPTLKSAAEF